MGEKRDRVRELRDQLSSRLGERAAFSSAVYRDAPIIMTASQMSSLLPEEIREMRRLLKDPALRRLSIAERFVEEAIVLQGCDDEFSGQADFECYFPTFEDMDDAQLRTYLTWRARARRGDVRPTSVSYVYVYLYELINHVGIEDDLQGWRALRAFADAYARIDAKILRLADQWADDYVVYYGLPADLLSPRFGLETSRAQEVLLHAALRSDEELAQALTRLGGYNVEASAFVSLHRRDFDRVLARVYRRMEEHYAKTARTYAQRLLGKRQALSCRPFARAVFSDVLDRDDYAYVAGLCDKVYCRNGRWSRVRYADVQKASRRIGNLVKTVDACMRKRYGECNPIEAPITMKFALKIVDEEAAAVLAERKVAEARVVHIDLGKLAAIRLAADQTAAKLIVDEVADEPGPQPDAGPQPEAGIGGDVSGPVAAAADLADEELGLLRALLSGGDVRSFERERGAMASLLAESINEKLFGLFDDIVIDAAQDPLRLIEDYRSDIEALVL